MFRECRTTSTWQSSSSCSSRNCQAALSNLISSDKIRDSEDLLKSFSEAIINFYHHYCLNKHSSPWCVHDKGGGKEGTLEILINEHQIFLQETDGTPYQCKHGFTCKAQAEGFKSLLEEMSIRPQDYVSQRGRLTTNTVEGFHGLALVYRSKRTDLGHLHYVCKTNMAICHKVY